GASASGAGFGMNAIFTGSCRPVATRSTTYPGSNTLQGVRAFLAIVEKSGTSDVTDALKELPSDAIQNATDAKGRNAIAGRQMVCWLLVASEKSIFISARESAAALLLTSTFTNA